MFKMSHLDNLDKLNIHVCNSSVQPFLSTATRF
jgi:hypothetical protein